jgi:hypothetical protein
MEAMNRMIQNNIFDLDTFFPIWKIWYKWVYRYRDHDESEKDPEWF